MHIMLLVTFTVIVSCSNLTEGTALSCAAANGHDMIVQYLLSNNALIAGGYHSLKVTNQTHVTIL